MNSHKRLLIGWLQKVGVGSLALAVSGCAVPRNSAQPQKSDSESLIAGWKIPLDWYGSTPVISDGMLYVGSLDGAVYALDTNTGERKWRFQTGENLPPANNVITVIPGTSLGAYLETLREKGERKVRMPPAVENGTVFIGSGDNSFYAIDAATGKKKWSYVAGPGMAGAWQAPVFKDGTVYFANEQRVHALDMATGERKWLFDALQEKPIPSRRIEGMVPGENAIFVTAWSRTAQRYEIKIPRSFLYAVAPDTGTTKWVTTFDGISISAPTTAKGIVFVTVEDPHPPGSSGRITLYAINTADGQIRWKLGSERTSSLSSLVIVGNTIYFSTDKSLFAAELETGRQLWSFSADGIHTLGVQADDQHLYVSAGKFGSKDTIHALALATGQEKWSQDGYWLSEAKMVHGGIVYAERGGNAFHAFDAASGRKLWSTKSPKDALPNLISGGRIFLISLTYTTRTGRVHQGHLYAINARTGKPRP